MPIFRNSKCLSLLCSIDHWCSHHVYLSTCTLTLCYISILHANLYVYIYIYKFLPQDPCLFWVSDFSKQIIHFFVRSLSISFWIQTKHVKFWNPMIHTKLTELLCAASVANTSSPLKKREKQYLMAVGYYRSGDFSRSRQLLEQCLEVSSVFHNIIWP